MVQADQLGIHPPALKKWEQSRIWRQRNPAEILSLFILKYFTIFRQNNLAVTEVGEGFGGKTILHAPCMHARNQYDIPKDSLDLYAESLNELQYAFDSQITTPSISSNQE